MVGSNGRVDDIEFPLGRTGDEEEVLVERRAEERAAEKFARPHRCEQGYMVAARLLSKQQHRRLCYYNSFWRFGSLWGEHGEGGEYDG